MNSIFADGRSQWLAACNSELEQRALDWFAVELNRGGWLRRQISIFWLRRRLTAIVRRREPSARTLW